MNEQPSGKQESQPSLPSNPIELTHQRRWRKPLQATFYLSEGNQEEFLESVFEFIDHLLADN